MFLLASSKVGSSSGSSDSLLRDTGSRLMGLIVLAMGIQFALTGLQAFFA
jgi:small neutral amino acid transporter SnatA (MarC family)